jgi:hypothetical protein
MNKGLFLPVFILLIIFSACRKDELTLPAKVFFEFEMISHQEEENLKSGAPFPVPGKMTVDRGTMSIRSIEFEGRRDQGRDVFFVTNMGQPLIIDLGEKNNNQALSFDIPQGVYSQIEIYLDLGGNDEIPLIIEGKISGGTPNEIPLRFEYNISDKLRARAESGQSGNKMVLRKDTPSKARIILDSPSVFQFVTMPVLMDAAISVIDGKEVLLINSNNNINLFNIMAERLEKSLRVIID